MRVRLKTRVIIAYLCAVCCGTVFFGLYFVFSPPVPPSKSRKGIERAARDSWSGVKDQGSKLHALLHFGMGPRRPDIAALLRPDKGEMLVQQQKGVENLDQQHVLPRPDKPLIVLPSKEQMMNTSWGELSNLYHSYTQQIQASCAAVERLGKVTDGGWEVCEDEPYRPKSPCLVYSFGVGDDFSFDDAVAQRYGCEVHSFDPSMQSGDHQRESTVRFHAVGLSDVSGKGPQGWKMSSLPDIRQLLGHSKTPLSILKLDVEEWEWKVLPALLKGGHLSDTTQLLMELHQCDGCAQFHPDQVDKEPPKERYITALSVLKDLYDLGFRIFWHHQNTACRYVSKFTLKERHACCEVHLVRTKTG